MNNESKEKLEAAITACANKAKSDSASSIEVLQFTQAALNAANAIATLCNIK